jgi:hypothetical protein
MFKVLLFKTAVVLSLSTPVFACADAGSQAAPAEIVSRYQNAVKDASTGDERAERARAFAVSLTDRDRLALARALAAGTRQDDAVFGAGLLVDRGLLKEAAPVYARFVTDGGDMTAHFWKWMHGDDAKTAPRAYIAIARELLARIDTLAGERRRAAEAFLLDAGYGPRIETYSRKAVEEKLSALEREIR